MSSLDSGDSARNNTVLGGCSVSSQIESTAWGELATNGQHEAGKQRRRWHTTWSRCNMVVGAALVPDGL